MEIISATRDEVRDALNDLLEHDMAKQRRQELSEQSFREWVYSTLRALFANLGYQLQSFEEFWQDIGINISEGWKEGRKQARREAELRRKMRERRYR